MTKVLQLLDERRKGWQQLERLCSLLEERRAARIPPETIEQFSNYYRAACADLALADSYQLPQSTVQYLHRLVGRAHNQLYRSRQFDYRGWLQTLVFEVPRQIFQDGAVQAAFCIFWSVFTLSAFLAASPYAAPGFAERLIGESGIERLEADFGAAQWGSRGSVDIMRASFYIRHNTGIGLMGFASGLLVVPGLVVALFNGSYLGACFGYMARPEVSAGQNFFEFVTAHGPFELTAIVLATGAGLRLGLGWLHTDGLTRLASLQRARQRAMPIMGASMVLFFFAAFIEAFISPSGVPYEFKALVALVSSGVLMVYFVVLGFPPAETNTAEEPLAGPRAGGR